MLLKYWGALIRFPNLLIVILTQYLLQYLIIIPVLKANQITPLLDHFHFFLLVSSTVIIAAGGYIINDLEDYEIDILNKPEKVIINQYISAHLAKKMYWGLSVLGFLISLYLAFHVKNLPLVLIYPIAVLLLFIYSKSLKKSVLWGNIIVSIFCAFVAGIVIFAEKSNVSFLIKNNNALGKDLLQLFIFYLIFAFLSTMFREIIKDIEDIEGDKKNNATTLPIVFGVALAKRVAQVFGIALVVVLVYWFFSKKQNGIDAGLIYIIIGIIFPLIFSIFKLKYATTKKQLHTLSQIAKYIMLSGILYLLF
ncbi:MAG TPA: hypothetical protein ENJ53_03210 [Phaeodactylibacter sp.]|nr:hypothetical protein [Phaeodactylibacter sp.]